MQNLARMHNAKVYDTHGRTYSSWDLREKILPGLGSGMGLGHGGKVPREELTYVKLR